MDVLVGFESSGKIRDAFTRKGHNAISCDLLPTQSPGPHYQGNILDVYLGDFDLFIAHPTCTKLAVSGNHVYAKGKPRYRERVKAAKWTEALWLDAIKEVEMVCFENPVGVLPTMTCMPKPYYIQPYEFGHNASKKTGLFLHNLPPLIPTRRVRGRFVNGVERWANQTDSGQNKLGPSPDRWRLRSETYQGIADAMANQWG